MKKHYKYSLLVCLALGLTAYTSVKAKVFNSNDNDNMAVGAQVSNDYIISPLKKGSTTAVYLTLKDTGTENDVIVAAVSPIAKKVQLHRINRDGKMIQVLNGVEVAAHSSKKLDGRKSIHSGGYHIMLINLKAALHKEQKVPLTLVFQDGTEKTIYAVAQ